MPDAIAEIVGRGNLELKTISELNIDCFVNVSGVTELTIRRVSLSGQMVGNSTSYPVDCLLLYQG